MSHLAHRPNFGSHLTAGLLQDIVMREAMVMRQQRHPNVLPLLAAFLSEAVLWMVMPYVAGGSAIHILNKRCPGVSSPLNHSTPSVSACELP